MMRKPEEKNLGCLYKSDREIKLKINLSYSAQGLLQRAVTNEKFYYFIVWTPHGKVIDTIIFYNVIQRDIKDKLIAFYKDFFTQKFLQKVVS